MQAIVFHEVIGKRIPALEQIRKGLRLLGVLDVMSDYTDLLEPVFIYTGNQLTFTSIAEKLVYSDSFDDHPRTRQFLERFLEEADQLLLEKFVIYCTGSKVLPQRSITVTCDDGLAIVSSTCLFSLTLPRGLVEYGQFYAGLYSVLLRGSKAFTSI